MFRRIHILLISLLFSGWASAQVPTDSLSNLRFKKTLLTSDSLRIDTLLIVPGSVQVAGIDAGDYHVDYPSATIIFAKQPADSVEIRYRIMPLSARTMNERYNFDSIRYNFTAENPYAVSGSKANERLVDMGDMNYYGSFGRGISFGNNQDAVVSSNLNLQINGFIGDSLEFTAAISDNNIPIQPDGNTHNIQDFERIFMQVKKGGWQLNFGDIDIRQTNERYLRFFKRLQGGSFLTEHTFKNGNKNSFVGSGAVAKGKFTRNIITAQEGNQGPYKLQGGNNELYFAVLAGTEKIYIDGVLMERGEDRDYIIDYNLAELTFTARRLITRDSRIQAEFEYTDRNYLNSMLYAKNEFTVSDKWKFSIGAFSNSDAKNSSINQSLSDQQRYFLSTIGNDVERALFPSAVMDTFSARKILYTKTDTTYNGITDTIFVHSTDKTRQLFDLSFTNVGAGKGNYIAAAGNANGRVFQWVAPVSGRPQGEWEPVILLVTPRKHQVFSGTAEYTVSQNTVMRLTGALSNYDVNTFSQIGNDENRGLAMRFDLDHKRPLIRSGKSFADLNTHIDYEYVGKRFNPIETLRSVEFYRDWGLSILPPPEDEQLLNIQLGLDNRKEHYVNYHFSSYLRGHDFNGIYNAVESVFDVGGFRFDNRVRITHVSSDFLKGNFFRPTFAVSKVLKDLAHYKIGASYAAENNSQYLRVYDTLSPASFAFNVWQAFLKSDEEKPVRWGVTYYRRENMVPRGKELLLADRSDNIALNAELLSNQNRQFRMNLTYRKLQTNTELIKGSAHDESILGRADYSFREWNGLFSGTVFYELGAGQEQKRQYTYVEVPSGQGFYMWVDYNEDGIPQLDEFEVAIYQDQKRWVRILTPTNEYIKANYIQFNYSLAFNPQQMKAGETAFLKFLKRFNTVSALQINKKEASAGRFNFDPFARPFSDSSLISLYSFLSNSIYFNRVSPVWGMDLTHRVNTNKAVLSYGFESNRIRDIGWRIRYNFSPTMSTGIRSNAKKRILSVPNFTMRNYEVSEWLIEPSLTYTYRTEFRASVFYGLEQKENASGEHEKAVNHSLTAEMRYNVFQSGVLSGSLKLNDIAYTGSTNTPVAYIMLDGLLPGKNLLWNVDLTKRLAGNIEMSLTYEGRKPASARVIHTGRASLRAIF